MLKFYFKSKKEITLLIIKLIQKQNKINKTS